MSVTIYDIAEATGVSIATVSKILNNKGSISQATRQRVLEAIDRLGYEPSAIASALAGKNTKSIGVLIPDINNPYYAEVIRGAEDEAFERGYSLLICNTDNNEEKDKIYLWTLRQKKMDGLIIATGSTSPQAIKDMIARNIRIVLMGREISGANLACVMIDDFTGAYLAGKHLLELGHRSFGIIMESLQFWPNAKRLNGFVTALQEENASYYTLSDDQYGIASGTKQAAELLSKHQITAIFASNDLLAVGALQACRELGKRVPDDISIMGFDDTVFAKIVYPSLTTVSQPIYEIGRRTASMLIQAIETGTQPTTKVVIESTLVIRQSTGPVAEQV